MPNWELIAKYLAGEATRVEKQEVEDWLNSDPANQLTLNGLKKAMRPHRLNEPDFSGSMEKDWLAIEKKVGGNKKILRVEAVRQANWWLKIAAAFLILVTVGYAIWFAANSPAFQDEQQYATLETLRVVTLSDSSRVWLNRDSRLTISSDFGDESRKVALVGEAYFEVAKDAARPFIVTAGDIITRVVGTEFNVKMVARHKTVKVTVTEGKVAVSNDEDEPVYLTLGEMATYRDNKLHKGKNSDLNFLAWKTGIVRFEGATLKEVCSFLSEHYNADIRLGEKSLDNQTITTVLDNLELQAALDIIATTLNLEIEKKDSTIYFH